jgi:hypothetical protein
MWRSLTAAAVAFALLGCGGLFSGPDPVAQEAELDAGDSAEQKRLRGDYEGAEKELKRRLNVNPRDARAWRLLGDVHFTRGQYYREKWSTNLGWAWDAYTSAVNVDPTSCLTWGRLAATAIAVSENPEFAIPRDQLDALPLEAGWEACQGATLLELEFRRVPEPRPESLRELAGAAPWMVSAVVRQDHSSLSWKEVLARPELASGAAFVVFPKSPITAGSVDGSKPRSFTYPEWLTVGSASAGRIVYLDRRFPERVPAIGVTRAPACRGTKWELQGANKVPVGQCRAGPHDRRVSEVYDPNQLRPAGTSHFHQPSIAPATVDWNDVAEDSVSCTGGAVGRMFVDTPSCQVAYDRAIPQRRSISSDGTGLVALSAEHAAKMVDVANGQELLGNDLADQLARGRVAEGLAYSLFTLSQPDLTGCRGRGIYQKARFVEGAVEFECKLGAVTYQFREMTLVGVTIGG